MNIPCWISFVLLFYLSMSPTQQEDIAAFLTDKSAAIFTSTTALGIAVGHSIWDASVMHR